MDKDDKVPPIGANDGDEEPVEKAEVKIADAMGMLAELLRGLHKTNAQGETVAITEDMDKDAKIREIAAMFAKLGEIVNACNGLWCPEAEKYLLSQLQK